MLPVDVQEFWQLYGSGIQHKFAVLSCGNGILVDLLRREGQNGFGMDLREGKCWPLFKMDGTDLRQIDTIDPNSPQWIQQQLRGVNFLIGKQCGQFTPWIPLIAARLRCNFFLMPGNDCFDFFTKFSRYPSIEQLRRQTQTEWTSYTGEQADLPQFSMYEQYLAYLEGNVCALLGFDVIVDKLRITSRKRKCLIGIVPAHGLPCDAVIETTINGILDAARAKTTAPVAQTSTQEYFAKTIKKKTTNCTSLPSNSNYREELTQKILSCLLNQNSKEQIGGWRCGGTIHLRELAAELLEQNDRQMLEGQSGGLQTFMRNQHQLFSVDAFGNVSIRRWPVIYGEFVCKAGQNIRRSECQFQKLHPDGCPLRPDQCPFKHL